MYKIWYRLRLSEILWWRYRRSSMIGQIHINYLKNINKNPAKKLKIQLIYINKFHGTKIILVNVLIDFHYGVPCRHVGFIYYGCNSKCKFLFCTRKRSYFYQKWIIENYFMLNEIYFLCSLQKHLAGSRLHFETSSLISECQWKCFLWYELYFKSF